MQKFDSSQIWLGLAQNNLNAKELVDWAQPSFLIFVLDFKKKEHVQWMLTIPKTIQVVIDAIEQLLVFKTQSAYPCHHVLR